MIRGMHWQAEPKAEIKLIRCTTGLIWDVVVDVRPGSVSYGQWEAFELSPGSGRQLYLPGGFAHGFQCLEDGSEIFYMMSSPYDPALARGFRWNDPAVALPWPLTEPALSDRDQALPMLSASQ